MFSLNMIYVFYEHMYLCTLNSAISYMCSVNYIYLCTPIFVCSMNIIHVLCEYIYSYTLNTLISYMYFVNIYMFVYTNI